MKMRKFFHHAHVLLFLALLVSGFLLHFSILRGLLAPYRLFLIKTHGYLGEVFAFVSILYLLYVLWSKRLSGRRFGKSELFIIASFLASAAWIGTGAILLQKANWGPVATAQAFEIHRWLGYSAVPAVLFHIWRVGLRPLTDVVSQPRRRFLGWLSLLLSGTWAASVGWRFLGTIRPQDVKGNANCDVFEPIPEPAKESLPPIGGGMRGKFGEYSASNFLPCLHHETWRFTIDGLVNRPITFTWNDFVRLPRKVQVSDFHCVEGWSVFDITYEGLKVIDLLQIAGIRPEAKFVKFYSADGEYADTLSIEQMLMPDVMVAMLMDGKPISRVLGGPARLIVPKMYAYKAVKWLVRMELIDKPYTGYWEFHGFETDAWLGKY